jgi:hypothetical protein
MKLVNLWKAKLKAAKIQHSIATRQLNAAQRSVDRLNFIICDLENKLERYMAKPKSKAKQPE